MTWGSAVFPVRMMMSEQSPRPENSDFSAPPFSKRQALRSRSTWAELP